MNLRNPTAEIRIRSARHLAIASAGLLLAMIGSTEAYGQGPKWTMTVIDHPAFHTSTRAHDINSSGQIVGRSFGTTDQETLSFVYDPDSGVSLVNDWLSTDDALTWQIFLYSGSSINDLGQIAGGGKLRDGSGSSAIRLTPPAIGEQYASLEDLGGSDSHGINLFGEVAGDSDLPEAAYWSASGAMSLLTPPSGSPAWSDAWEIEDSGELVGRVYFASGASRALYWSSPTASPIVLPYLALGANNLPSGIATDMNSSGLIVGSSSKGKSGGITVSRAFSYDLNGRQLKDLGSFLGGDSRAESINDAGAIVGWSTPKNKTIVSSRPFFYSTATGMVDLKTAIINLPSGASLEGSASINESNEIVVSVRLSDGRLRPALLRPWLP
jgi:probable HAF family extracellular repeat protein